MKLKYTPRAEDDLRLAIRWYEDQRKGLGLEFLDCIEFAIKRILAFPESYEKPYASFHRCTVRRFPFSIFYTIEDGTIIIHAIFDNRQDPVNLP
ncbi:MAG: type II toxin-antitoxin system RelE/ParE family toxin [Deltaproteobacteria bacterium]|jgi:toxin ParE1/3/4|nr:type II toxin-antitoxin system RelE/ParE family toxin [Deltaproteobacteria bacterium]MBT4639499.1 type II toxin-antitoxin system RelE/ParE family toxin [Deltaproteobacteria bacterium]MBT6501936.1 type II toxin-antitoxin system RelE/ParE family toxin [Deltaproteobacteria bacterium]MBT6613136.1 type II toxin-antitoxin system RelE/ParE family toxin [Deltaproteobacteria bacterium]MBT7154509.1 type II toxin-antitoxin system RelE/ParE family toxin [Deltaproteobacteria bacterium]